MIQDITATEVMISALIPKTYTVIKNAGINAMSTSYISLLDVLSEWTCGEADMIIFSSAILVFSSLKFFYNAFTKPDIVQQRPVGRANIATGTTFDTCENIFVPGPFIIPFFG